MKYGIQLRKIGDGTIVVIASKRNNWKPTDDEPKSPPEHVIRDLGLTRAGVERPIPPTYVRRSLLVDVLMGGDSHEVVLLREVDKSARKVEPPIVRRRRELGRKKCDCGRRPAVSKFRNVIMKEDSGSSG